MAAISTRQSLLLAAAKKRPSKRRMIGGVIQEPELCLYCMHKYSNNDDVYATPSCLLKNETLPALGGVFSREIRQYLRADRKKDSAPDKRDGTEGVYLFPACCSCCKCSSCGRRLPGNEEQEHEGDDNEGGDGDGDGGGFEDGDGFFDGGHDGYSANENDYLYMICGAKKDYPRAMCLQEGVRYSFPKVGYIVVDDEGEETVETMHSICLSWPEEKYPIHFFDTNCIVIQRSVVFADAPLAPETLFLCNCRCGDGKAGLALQEEMENVMSYQSDPGNTIIRADFEQNILRLYGRYRLTRPEDLVVSLLCLECVHTHALRKAYSTSKVIDVPESPVLKKPQPSYLQTKPFRLMCER
jgi:hypothetical protein